MCHLTTQSTSYPGEVRGSDRPPRESKRSNCNTHKPRQQLPVQLSTPHVKLDVQTFALCLHWETTGRNTRGWSRVKIHLFNGSHSVLIRSHFASPYRSFRIGSCYPSCFQCVKPFGDNRVRCVRDSHRSHCSRKAPKAFIQIQITWLHMKKVTP